MFMFTNKLTQSFEYEQMDFSENQCLKSTLDLIEYKSYTIEPHHWLPVSIVRCDSKWLVLAVSAHLHNITVHSNYRLHNSKFMLQTDINNATSP